MNREDIAAVLARVPQLCDTGIGAHSCKKYKSDHDEAEDFRAQRGHLLESAVICTKICEWLSNLRPIQTINTRYSSYELKHMAERDIGEYVSNGQFIAAAIHCRFAYKTNPKDPFVCLGVSSRSIAAIRKRQES